MDTTVKIQNSSYERENEATKQYQERNSAKQVRERQKHAQAIKQRSINRSEIKERFKTAFAHVKLDLEVEQQIDEETELQVEQEIEQEAQISINISSDNKNPPGKKPKIVESDGDTVIEINFLYETTELSKIAVARYEAYKKIIKDLKMPDVATILLSDDHELKERYLIPMKELTTPEQILIDMNGNKEDRLKYVTTFDPLPLTNQDKSINILKEFIKEVKESNESNALSEYSDMKTLAGEIIDKYEQFTKENLIERFKIIEELEQIPKFNMKDVQQLQVKLSELNKVQFEQWHKCFKMKNVKENLLNHLTKCSRECPTFMQMVTENFAKNVRYYTKDEHQNFVLQYNYNSDVHDTIYLTMVDDKFIELTFDIASYELDQHRETAQRKIKQIVNDLEQCNSVDAIEVYMDEKKYNEDTQNLVYDQSSCLYNFVVGSDIDFLVDLFIGVSEESIEIKEITEFKEKLETMIQVGAAAILHYMADRLRHMERLNITIRDISLVINSTLAFAEKAKKQRARDLVSTFNASSLRIISWKKNKL